jgi:hypothetical protein
MTQEITFTAETAEFAETIRNFGDCCPRKPTLFPAFLPGRSSCAVA